MEVEILATGSELLTPDRSDTNSLWLTARLDELGLEVRRKTIVGGWLAAWAV
jgi:nicotinamide-nucleotide amidase